MTLRDWFAGQALTKLEFALTGHDDPEKVEDIVWAREAYGMADAMLAAREEGDMNLPALIEDMPMREYLADPADPIRRSRPGPSSG